MQSTRLATLRATVMLGFLIVVPTVAVLGTSLPQWVQKQLRGRAAYEQGSTGGPLRLRASAAAQQPMQTATAIMTGGPAEGQPAAPDALAPRRDDSQRGGQTWPGVPVNYETPGGGSSLPGHPAAYPVTGYPAPQRFVEVPRDGTGGVVVPVPGDGPHGRSAGPANNDVQAATLVTDRFLSIQHRLRQLGAAYYLLETWGQGGLYRFHCRLGVGQYAEASLHFEAVEADPLAAMQSVLEQVEAWRARGLPATPMHP